MSASAERDLLLIGSGGREHVLAWKLAQSPHVARIWVAPGNGGTAGAAGARVQNVAIAATDVEALLAFAQAQGVDLTIVGPEAPLAAGLVDRLQAAGLRCFGPTQAAAQLETSKAFAKDFMWELGIPTARFATFSAYDAALEYVRLAERPLVVKAGGLAAGKGVIVCDDRLHAEQALFDMFRTRRFGDAADEVIVEERLEGREVSLLAFCDGKTVVPMVAACDYKRFGDRDQGPNTGGMGAYAPAAALGPDLIEEALATVLQPAVDGLADQGTPYVGVLYAGLMLTGQGLRVLEFNCRFGDPEAQAILPLLSSDLFEIVDACLDRRLAEVPLEWLPDAAVTVVAAAPGYPGSYPSGSLITGIEAAQALPGVTVFQAGTEQHAAGLVTAGGRVLAVSALGDDLAEARQRAYAGMAHIAFAGMHYRHDIGAV